MPRDLTDLIVTLSRIQSDLRALQANLYAYPENPSAEATIVTLVDVLHARVQQWMAQPPHAPRSEERRQHPQRRMHERRVALPQAPVP